MQWGIHSSSAADTFLHLLATEPHLARSSGGRWTRMPTKMSWPRSSSGSRIQAAAGLFTAHSRPTWAFLRITDFPISRYLERLVVLASAFMHWSGGQKNVQPGGWHSGRLCRPATFHERLHELFATRSIIYMTEKCAQRTGTYYSGQRQSLHLPPGQSLQVPRLIWIAQHSC